MTSQCIFLFQFQGLAELDRGDIHLYFMAVEKY